MWLDPAVAACRVAVRRCIDDLLVGSLAAADLATERLAPGDLVLVACSGGADSLALGAAALWELPRAGLRAGLICVDHRLQDGSAERAAALIAWAAAAGAEPAEAVAVTVGTTGGPEAAARTARYAALAAAAARHDAGSVLLGHTADDQAETVLLGLARGSGARSLAGMPAHRGVYRRPLLGLPRATTAAACAALDLPVWHDPHNADPAYARARVRSTAMPALVAALGPGAVAGLTRSAAQLRDDADALDGWAERESARAARHEPGVELPILDVWVLAGLPAAIRRRVLLGAARGAGVPAGRLAASHLAALDALVTTWHGQGPVALPGRIVASRGYARESAGQAYGVLRFTTPKER